MNIMKPKMSHKERQAIYKEAVKRNKQAADQRRVESLRREVVMRLIFIVGLLASIHSITIYNQTIISPLFWLPIIGLSIILVLISLTGANKMAFGEKLILGVSIGMLMTLGFLFVNYHYADWDKHPEIRTYKVVETGVYRYRRHGRHSYWVQIDLGDMKKDIRFTPKEGYDERVLDSRTVQLRLYPGRFGYKVYKDKLAQ